MQIKRNYREPFFREKRRGAGRWRWLLVLALLIGGALYVIATRPAMVTSATNYLTGNLPTPTPLPRELADQATGHYQQGRLEQAAELLARVVAERPEHIGYMYEYGQILLDLDRADEALELSQRITRLDPNDVRGFALRARALVWRGESSTAIPVAQAGLELDPNFGPLHAAISRAYTATSEWRRGVDHGLMAAETAPDDVRSWWAYGSALAAVGATEEAIAAFDQAIAILPTFLPPYFEQAILYLSSDRDQEAIDTYDRILGLEPRNARALLRQCQAYRKVGEFERALGLCQDAVDADPTFAAAQFQLGLLRYNRREFAAARDAFQTCHELQEDNLECTYRLGLAHYYLAREAYSVCGGQPDTCTAAGAGELTYEEHCDLAWDLLQSGLIMAQVDSTANAPAIEIIREGLTAISGDTACPGHSASPLVPDSSPDSSEEDTEGTGDAGETQPETDQEAASGET